MDESWVKEKDLILERLMAKTACALKSASMGDFDAVDACLYERAMEFRKLELHEKRAHLKELLEGFAKFEIWTKELERIQESDRELATLILKGQERLKNTIRSLDGAKQEIVRAEGSTGKGMNLDFRG